MSNLPKPSEVNADNIIKPNLEELSAEHRQAYEEYKKAREEKELQDFLANFKKDRQGNITPVGEIRFPPLQAGQVKPAVSNNPFTPEQLAELQYHISQSAKSIHDVILERDKAKENTPLNCSSELQPMSQSQDNRLMPMFTSPAPIQSIPYSARQPDQVEYSGDETAPVQNPALWVQAAPMTNPSAEPTQLRTRDDLTAQLRREFEQMAYEKLGITLKPRNYTKPYPEYFDLTPYPPGYRVPEFSKFNGMDNKTT